MTEYAYRYVTAKNGAPLRRCACGGDLTTDGGVDIVFFDDGRGNWQEPSNLNQGRLVDPHGHVAQGLHSTTLCGHCGEQLHNLEGVRELCEEAEA